MYLLLQMDQWVSPTKFIPIGSWVGALTELLLLCYYLVTTLAFTKKPQRNNEALAPTDRPEVE